VWTEPKVVTATFHKLFYPTASANDENPRPRALLTLDSDGLQHDVNCPTQLREALEQLAAGALVRIEYRGVKPGSRVKLFTITNLDIEPCATAV